MLAHEVTVLVHGPDAARQAEVASAALFGGRGADGVTNDAAPSAVLPAEAVTWPLWKLLASTVEQAGAPMSTSEARRLIQQGGVELDGVRAEGIEQKIPAGPHTVKIGKRRIYKIIVAAP